MSNIILFEEKHVRRAWDKGAEKWLFAIVDVIAILTCSPNPQVYWRVMKKRLRDEGNQTVTNCNALKMTAADGKQRLTDVADTEQLLRLIQSIPSPKAEPFKLWLAQVGYERLEEIENPELAAKRTREIYEQKGYSEEWIEKRLRGIAVRDELTDEWKKRGVKEQKEFAILTAEISKAAFGMTPAEYKDFKTLANPKENLRDHMSDLELIFTMLGEASTTEIAKKKDAQGFPANKHAAHAGGTIAGNARRELESQSGTKVSTKANFKELPEAKTRSLRKGKQHE
jgi:methylphosphotriester-DNA--protein-cysteine methyltransferase